MRRRLAVILIAVSLTAVLAAAPPAAFASPLPAPGQSVEEQWQRCGAWDPETEGANPVIQACTAAIQSGRLNSEGLAYALGKRAYAYYVDYEWESALQDANRSIELNSSNAWALALRGFVWEELDEAGRALDDYNRSLALDATDPYVFYRRGRIYEDLEMVDNALRDFDTAIRLDPADRDSMRRRAIIYEGHFGDIDRAIAEWEQIVALGLLDPSVVESLQVLSGLEVPITPPERITPGRWSSIRSTRSPITIAAPPTSSGASWASPSPTTAGPSPWIRGSRTASTTAVSPT
jgi:tetratricopeptide (TPR) repeat protein